MRKFSCNLSKEFVLKKFSTIIVLLSIFLSFVANAENDGPKCTQDDMWEYAINNAYRVADEYATNHNPSSTFFALKKEYSFEKQLKGKYKGKYLLLITNEHGNHISFATLLPLFDVNKSTNKLDDEKPLWKVVSAKLNGRQY